MMTAKVVSRRSGGVLAIIVGLSTLSVGPSATAQVASKLPTPAELLDKMVRDFTPKVPTDVDKPLKEQFEAQKKFAEVQLQFDILSWESFVALCWPTDKARKPFPRSPMRGNRHSIITSPIRMFFRLILTINHQSLPNPGKTSVSSTTSSSLTSIRANVS